MWCWPLIFDAIPPPADPSPADANDPDKTIHLGSLSVTDRVRENGDRILGEMLGSVIMGTACEGDTIGPYRLCEMLGARTA